MQTALIRRQAGATIMEILVSVLILSFGILALVGLQARSLSAASDAKFRVEATNFADQILGQMWADRINLASYPSFPPGTAAATWRDQVTASLPGATAPTITVTPTVVNFPPPPPPSPVPAPLRGNLVRVTVNWIPPGHPVGAPPHNVIVQTWIENP